jgi:hypothetical protein
LDQLQNIELLFVNGNISYLNFDNLINLKLLSLEGTLNKSFNFEIFKNLSIQLESIMIFLNNIDKKTLVKLLHGHNFSNLLSFSLRKCNIRKLKKKFIDKFPMVTRLCIMDCNVEIIENDTFSNLKQLNELILMDNRIEFIEKNTFSSLKNLERLDLSYNGLKNVDREFIGISNSVKLEYENE